VIGFAVDVVVVVVDVVGLAAYSPPHTTLLFPDV
jgi:hypothetical protein